jgi:hypothetical protein
LDDACHLLPTLGLAFLFLKGKLWGRSPQCKNFFINERQNKGYRVLTGRLTKSI